MDIIQTIDATILTPLVRQVLGSDMLELGDWHVHPIHGGATANAGVYRFAGQAYDRGGGVPWSLILKVWRWREGRDDPASWNYWKRELLAYRSGVLDDLPGGLVAPRCFGVGELPG